jgi:hypothetical protein
MRTFLRRQDSGHPQLRELEAADERLYLPRQDGCGLLVAIRATEPAVTRGLRPGATLVDLQGDEELVVLGDARGRIDEKLVRPPSWVVLIDVRSGGLGEVALELVVLAGQCPLQRL